MNRAGNVAGQQLFYSPDELLRHKPDDVVVKLDPPSQRISQTNSNRKGVNNGGGQWRCNETGSKSTSVRNTATVSSTGSMCIGKRQVYSIEYMLSMSSKVDCQGPPATFPQSMVRIMQPQYVKSLKQRRHSSSHSSSHSHSHSHNTGGAKRNASGGGRYFDDDV